MQGLINHEMSYSKKQLLQNIIVYNSYIYSKSTGIINISNQKGIQLNKVAIYSIDGRLLKEIKDISTNSINIEKLVNGAYVLKIYFEESKTFLTKIVLKK